MTRKSSDRFVTYTIEVEVDTPPPEGEALDDLMDRLEECSPSISTGQGRSTLVLITVPAVSLRQAFSTALALLEPLGAPTMATIKTEARHHAEQGWPEVPELLSISEAAGTMGVSRQRVLQLVNDGRLPRHQVGKHLAIPRIVAEHAR